MRELLLFRHAKALQGQPAALDHERDLAPRGRRSARRMGQLLQDEGCLPSLVLCSTARRTVRTLELAAEAWTAEPAVRYLKTLYLAPPDRLLQAVRRQAADAVRLMLVGHNPGLQRLAVVLLAEGEETAPTTRLTEKFPTGAIARIAFDTDAWSGLRPASGRLVAFWRPRDLED